MALWFDGRILIDDGEGVEAAGSGEGDICWEEGRRNMAAEECGELW